MTNRTPERGTMRTGVGLVVLGTVLGMAVLGAAWTGDGSPSRSRAIAFSAAVCGLAALGGWIVARWPVRTPGMAVAGGLAAVALRLALPLAALGWLQTYGRDLRTVGADRLLLIFYLALLATDVALHMMVTTRTGRRRGENVAN